MHDEKIRAHKIVGFILFSKYINSTAKVPPLESKPHQIWKVLFSEEGNKLHFAHKSQPAHSIVLSSAPSLWISPFHISVPAAQHPPNFRERLLRAPTVKQ